MSARRRGWSSADSQQPKEWVSVTIPKPVFNGVEEKHRFEDAWAETPRKPGESLADHMARVVAAAQAAGRQPGEEG